MSKRIVVVNGGSHRSAIQEFLSQQEVCIKDPSIDEMNLNSKQQIILEDPDMSTINKDATEALLGIIGKGQEYIIQMKSGEKHYVDTMDIKNPGEQDICPVCGCIEWENSFCRGCSSFYNRAKVRRVVCTENDIYRKEIGTMGLSSFKVIAYHRETMDRIYKLRQQERLLAQAIVEVGERQQENLSKAIDWADSTLEKEGK